MKNQESIFDIKCDIAQLKQNIAIRNIMLSDFIDEAHIDNYEYGNFRDYRMLRKLEKRKAKLEKQDRKTWRECLAETRR